jgi:hypothetical protein
MFTELLQVEDDMAGTIKKDEVKKWVDEAISGALSKASADQPKPNAWPTWLENIRLWSAPAIAVTIAIFVLNEWSKYVEFRTHTNDQFEKILAYWVRSESLLQRRSRKSRKVKIPQKSFWLRPGDRTLCQSRLRS